MINTAVDRHAEALAEVSSMRDTIIAQKEEISNLNRELQTERDRVHILLEERARWRADAMACRTFVVKLATIQEQVNRATEGAAHILGEMAAMDSQATSEIAIKEATTSIEDNLRKLREAENGKPNPVETLPEGTLPHS